MIDGHIHIERGDYTLEWIDRFVDKAGKMQVDEIRLLEHCYIFEEFVPMYSSVCAYSEYIDAWFKRSAGKHKMAEYFKLIENVRKQRYPVEIKFGLEICYFREHEKFIEKLTKDKGFDFLLGSVHFVDDFAFDHKPEHWEGIDVDKIYRRYFEESIALAKSKLFDGIGHPDTIKLFGHSPSFSLLNYYKNLAKALADNGMYADQNSGVARRCPKTSSLGMDKKLLQALKKHGVNIITSSDAHCPNDVGDRIFDLGKCVVNA
ncbi:MAG: histidinol-phosphatase HisJ family protein [Bacteroidales bacterium]|nr:histidinol-phosphatase HisJ family protein [Bacteroidales bacterium]